MPGRVISEQIYTLAVPVPANTTVAAPLVTPWDVDNSTLDKVEMAFTRGGAFLVGVRLKYSRQIIVPWSATTNAASNSWVVGSAETVAIPVNFDVDGGLSIETYNLDTVNFHTVFLRAYVRNNSTLDTAQPATGVPAVAVQSGGGVGSSGDGSVGDLAGLALGALDTPAMSPL